MPFVGSKLTLLRRVVGLTAVTSLLASAVMFYHVAPGLPTTPKPPLPVATPAATPIPTATPAPTADPAPAPTPTGLRPGPGVTEPGIFLLATPASDGSLDVAEMVRLPTPTSVLTLQPPSVTAAGRDFAKARPTADQVQVSAGDQPVMVPDGRVTATAITDLGAAVRTVELRYRLSGVTVRSMPSKAGRALAALGPLTAGVPDDLPVMIAVGGDSVRNLLCPQRRLSEQACAAGAAPRLRINRTLPRRTALVVVQLDLPRPQ